MENPKGDAMKPEDLDSSGEISDLDNEVQSTNTWPSGLPKGVDYYDYFLGDDYDDEMHNKLSVDEADLILSPLTIIILEREKAQEELMDMVQHLVKEHPELIPSAKELLEALECDCDCDDNKHAEKAMELLKNQHVHQGFVRIFAEGFAVLRSVNQLAENELECRTVANRVARIRRDPLLDKCVSAKGDVDIMRGGLCILVAYWIDRRLERWLSEQASQHEKIIPNIFLVSNISCYYFLLSCVQLPQIRSNTQIGHRIRATNKMMSQCEELGVGV
ncbi:tRNA (mo5U34)-methyltransferase [Striga asiatica]|uniref:tRNA (Mo5U34)-methyltransferase n=1 Tax=Striga asiatica TaxID=4170 RepID=A0A5A7RH60_STRAF|nr:tRNA (mo5U34)-methyltransferase [Striga asiatica]